MPSLPPPLTPPSPWRALGLAGAGLGMTTLASGTPGRILGLLGGLWGLAWMVHNHFRSRELVERLAATLPVPARDQTLFREATKAWKALEEARDQAEAAAQAESGLGRVLLDQLRIGILLLDASRSLAVFNSSARTLLGSSSHLVAGSSLEEVFREPEGLRRLQEAYEGQTCEWTLRRLPRTLQIRAAPCPDRQGEPGVLVTVEDITQREALETTRQKFISNASHELKTPVAGIRIAAENLQDGAFVLSEGQQSLGAILRATERMAMLLDDISELSRIETGALRLEPQDLDPREFLKSLLREWEPQATSRGIWLRTQVQPDLEGTLRADPLRLHQLLGNLLSNAVKFSPEGGQVDLELGCQDAGFLWTVRDQGPGIPPSEQAHIFERFYRSPSARGIPGTGLGLSIVKHLALLMDGEVEVESEVGRGSTFILRLPRADGRR